MSSSFSQRFARAFPTPRFLLPLSAGVDISDASVKWLAFDPGHAAARILSYGEELIDPDIVSHGTIVDEHAFTAVLSALKRKLGGITRVHAAFPEDVAYVFSLSVPKGSTRDQALRMIEFEFEGRVPIPASAAVYDFDIIDDSGPEETMEIGVTVFPRDLAESYARCFSEAGLTLCSLEVDAGSIGRAISTGEHTEPVTLVVDFGRTRTGFAILKRGIPIFTSAVEIGGDTITQTLQKELKLSGPAIEDFKNEQGLLAQGGPKSAGVEAIAGTASALSAEILRHYNYWDTRRNEHGERVSPVGKIVLVGGSANLRGLCDYVAGRVQAPVVFGDVWQHAFSFDDYLPPIDRRQSLAYATAAGLALRGL